MYSLLLSSRFLRFLPLAILSACAAGGGGESSTISASAFCAGSSSVQSPSGSSGAANVFLVDPATSSSNASLSPGSSLVGNYAQQVQLSRLNGTGTLSGEYLDVVSGICDLESGAFDDQNQFLYDYGDPRFGEAMDYYHGDRFLSSLDGALPGASLGWRPFVITSCPYEDNAFYAQDNSGNDLICMGTSSRFSKGLFSHDAQVTVHELQHAVTGHAYSATYDFNRLEYDDAGSINEGISDFVSVMMTEADIPAAMDFRIFSRWGLGALLYNMARGVARCPKYDATYPTCSGFNVGASGFSAAQKRVSFTYPDGLGWPMAQEYFTSDRLRREYASNYFPEQIHQNGIIASGVLWDAYENLIDAGLSRSQAQEKMHNLLDEALASLPKPDGTNVSPVTFPGFGTALVNTATALGWNASERTAISNATSARGLTSIPTLGSNWATRGPGGTNGVRIVDYPQSNTQQTNGFLNRTDYGALFFDISNVDSVTAGSLLLEVTIPDTTRLQFVGSGDLDQFQNYGYLSSGRAMIRYAKVNGSAIVSALSDSSPTEDISTGSTYFQTNSRYLNSSTALFVKVPPGATTGNIDLTVKITPANGPSVTLTYTVEIRS